MACESVVDLGIPRFGLMFPALELVSNKTSPSTPAPPPRKKAEITELGFQRVLQCYRRADGGSPGSWALGSSRDAVLDTEGTN